MPRQNRNGEPRLTPKERAWYGVVSTFVDVDTGRLRTVHFEGTTMEAVAKAADWCDEHGAGWRVRCLSTPVSINVDLRNRGGRHKGSPSHTESILLGRAGRTDLIEKLRGTRGADDIAENRRRLGHG